MERLEKNIQQRINDHAHFNWAGLLLTQNMNAGYVKNKKDAKDKKNQEA